MPANKMHSGKEKRRKIYICQNVMDQSNRMKLQLFEECELAAQLYVFFHVQLLKKVMHVLKAENGLFPVQKTNIYLFSLIFVLFG